MFKGDLRDITIKIAKRTWQYLYFYMIFSIFSFVFDEFPIFNYTWIYLKIPLSLFTGRKYSGILCEMFLLGEGGEELKQVVVCI